MQWEFEKTVFKRAPGQRGNPCPLISSEIRLLNHGLLGWGEPGAGSDLNPPSRRSLTQATGSVERLLHAAGRGSRAWELGFSGGCWATGEKPLTPGSSNLAFLDYSLRGQALHGAEAGGLRGL